MRAAVLTEAGGIPQIAEFEEPQAEDGVEIGTVVVGALNPVDRALASGMLGPPKVPSVVGQEGVARRDDGTRVYFTGVRPPFGALAERVPLDGRMVELPEDVADADAVAIGVAGTTALLALRNHGGLQAGETVLVLGASGPLGGTAVQVAKRLGAGRVVAAARHLPSLERLRDSGAADAIVQLTGDDGEALDAAAEGKYDLVLDPIFGPTAEAALPATKPGSRYVVCGSVAPSVTLTYKDLIGRRLISVLSGPATPEDLYRSTYEDLLGYLASGDLTMVVERKPFEQVSEAWEEQGGSPHRKLVLEL